MGADRDLLAVIDPCLHELGDARCWWLALSGGSDSVALLDLVYRWCQVHKSPALQVVHVHHHLHPNADSWADHCAQQAQQRGLGFHCAHVSLSDVKGRGLEGAARKARYGVFEQLLSEGDALLMAHHADDQAETILYRLLRGAGPRGLSGMPATRSLGAGRLSRPLLSVPRASLDAYVHAQQLPFVTDTSNDDLRFDRNFLRHQVFPVLRTRWPSLLHTIGRTGELQREAVQALGAAHWDVMDNAFGDVGWRWHSTDVRALAGQLHQWLSIDGLPSPPRQRLWEFARQTLEAAPDTLPSLRVNDYRLVRWQQRIWRTQAMSVVGGADGAVNAFEQKEAALQPSAAAQLENATPATVVAGQVSAGAWGVLTWHPVTSGARGIPEGTVLQLQIRPAGAMVAPPGAPRRPFKQFARERGVPPWWRQQLPWLFLAEQPIAVVGAGLLDGIDALPQTGDTPLLIPHWAPATITDSIE